MSGTPRLGWRRRTARHLRVLASWLEARQVIPHRSGIPHRLRGRAELHDLADRAATRTLSVVPDGPDAPSHLPPGGPPFIVPREEWEQDGLEVTVARHAAEGNDLPRCAAVIWPSNASGWGRCPGVLFAGHCSAYGSQHDDANRKEGQT